MATQPAGNAPAQVLKRIESYLNKDSFDKGKGDEAWVVIDKDQWTTQQLREIQNWADSKDYCGCALSNPKFEYWLLLHFERGDGIDSDDSMKRRLKNHLPNFNKELTPFSSKFTKEHNISDNTC